MNLKMRNIIYCLLILLFMVGCGDESTIPSPPPGGGNIELPNQRVAFAIHTLSPTFQSPITRTGTADEDNIAGDMWVFVFDASNSDTLFLEAVKASNHEYTSIVGQSRRTANLKVRNHKVTLLVIDNAPKKISDGTNEVTITDLPSSWGLSSTTKLSDARPLLNTVLLASPQTVVPYTQTLPIPMSTELNREKLDASVHLGNETSPIPLLRVVAKLSVKKDFISTGTTIAPNFTLIGATVYNTPKNASLFPTHKNNIGNLTNYIGSGIGNEISGIALAVNDSTTMNPIYIYPSAEIDVTYQPFVLIQARYADDTQDSYFKLFISPRGKPQGRVERNTNYRILIKECTGRGYASIADAVAAPPSNLIYSVEVTDLSSHDIIDNGQYYIGLSNSEYHFYAQNSFVNMPIATIHSGINPGADALPRNIIISSSDPTNLIVQTISINHPTNGNVIRASVTKEFTEGIITVNLGNLSKQIKVVRKSNSFLDIKDELIVNDTYKDSKYKVASVETTKPWIKLGTKSSVNLKNGQDMVASDAGGVYIAYNTNIAAPDLENVVYISSANNGRIKVHFFLSPLVFINTDAPTIIDRNAHGFGSSNTAHTFNFNNPNNYDYVIDLFPVPGYPLISAGVQSTSGTDSKKTVYYDPLIEGNIINLPRNFIAKVQVGSYWYEFGYHLQQLWEF